MLHTAPLTVAEASRLPTSNYELLEDGNLTGDVRKQWLNVRYGVNRDRGGSEAGPAMSAIPSK
jgi:hypothetical protein